MRKSSREIAKKVGVPGCDSRQDLNWRDSGTSAFLSYALTLLSSPQLQLLGDDVSVPAVFEGQTLRGDHSERGVIRPSCTALLLIEVATGTSIENAHSMIKKAVAISQRTLGKHHRDTLRFRQSEAEYTELQGDSIGSERLLRGILAAQISTLGNHHCNSLSTMRSLTRVIDNQDRHVEAEDLVLQLIGLHGQTYGERHEDTIDVMQDLSDVSVSQGPSDEATELNFQVPKLGSFLQSLKALATNFELQGEDEQAEELYLGLIENEDKSRYASLEMDTILLELGSLNVKQGLDNKAERYKVRALAYCQEMFGDCEPRPWVAMRNLSSVYFRQQRYDNAEKLSLVSFEQMRNRLCGSDPRTLESMLDLSRVQRMQGKSDESKKNFMDVVSLRLKVLGDQDEQYNSLVNVLWDMCRVNPDGPEVSKPILGTSSQSERMERAESDSAEETQPSPA